MPDRPSLFQRGMFKLHSSLWSSFKIECDALTDEDVSVLALLLAERLPPFGAVEGVPQGGLRLAEAMEPYVSTGPLLIVDDVFTTGGSMDDHRAGREADGAVIFARHDPPPWVYPLFALGPPWQPSG